MWVSQITPTQFLESINAINELLISAYTLRHSFLDNMLAIFTFQISKLFLTSHFEKVRVYCSHFCDVFSHENQEMMRLRHLIDDLNIGTFNPVGLNILWPRSVAFLYVTYFFSLRFRIYTDDFVGTA